MAILNVAENLLPGGHSVILVVFMTTTLLLAWHLLHVKHDPREPPLVRPKIPFIGHLIGIILHGTRYYYSLGQDNPDLPIFTLPLGLTKIYIISSPQLIQGAMKRKTIDFDSLIMAFVERMVGFGPKIMELMRNPPTDGSEKWLDAQHRAYDPIKTLGPALYDMNAHVLNRISDIFNVIGPDFETKTFYLWIRNTFTIATTGALFGFQNPLTKDPKLNDMLWDFETGQANLLLQPFPSLTARKPYQARIAIQKALRTYFEAGYDQNPDVSAVVKSRSAVNREWGLPISAVADHELGILFASVTNSIPALFWLIFYIFRDPKLVEDLQKELLEILEERENAQGQRECIFDISKFGTHCPLLFSAYQEIMRLAGQQSGTRVVLEDTYLDYTPAGEESGTPRSFLLKKGVILQMPSRISNFASATWGADANEFNPRRFIAGRDKERVQKKAFNPFGGGKHLCPGRHFAFAEILGAVATLVLGFEILTPEDGRVYVPAMNSNVVEAIAKPLQKVQSSLLAKIRRRPGWEDVKWGFTAGNDVK